MHVKSEPPILYFGTPVVLISTVNEDGSYNLAPMSSAFWLMWRAILGLGGASKTTENLIRTRECVLNLPSVNEVAAVNRLALTTGSHPIPAFKASCGYRHVKDKFHLAGLTPVASETVAAPRVHECPVQMEAVLEECYIMANSNDTIRGATMALEVRIQRVFVDKTILVPGESNRIDPDKWRPLIMSFQHFYGLGAKMHQSTLSSIPEAAYRSPEVDLARGVKLA